jgi:hypothetical protein
MEAQEYNYIRREPLNLVDVDLSAYRSQQVQRRLATLLLRSGHPNWPSFFRTVRDDPGSLRSEAVYVVQDTLADSEHVQPISTFEGLRVNPWLI